MKKLLTAAASALIVLTAGCTKKSSTDTSAPDLKVETATINSESVPVTSSEAASTSSTTTTTATTTAAKSTTSTTTTTAAPQPPADLRINTNGSSLEAGSDVKIKDLITDSNVEILSGDTYVNTSEPGEYELPVSYSYNGNKFETKLNYSVCDTTPPLLLNSGWSAVHITGTPFDINDYVGFVDNCDRSPVLTYSGNFDPNTPGQYPLSATVTDSSGNETSWDLTITVADSKPYTPDTTPRVDFSDFIAAYNGEGRRFGIDVSAWQTNVDFNAVRDAGCSFVMIRIGYYYDHVVMDDYFRQNIENARAAGLDVGLYFYTTDNTEEGVREHARWIINELGGTSLELPIAFDWEEFGNFQKYGMNISDLNSIYAAFADELSKSGYSSMLYSSKNFLNNFWTERTKSLHPVWLAHFVDETDYQGDYAIWQASCYGHIPGINGDVDMNILYRDLPLE